MVGMLTRLIRASSERAVREHTVSRPFRLPASLADLPPDRRHRLEEMVILGALMQLVAHADEEFSAREERAIRKVLMEDGSATERETGLVLAAAHEARESRPEIHGFTREVSKRPYKERIRVLELLFRIGFADTKLSLIELEMIRKIARLFWITHKDFTDAKLRVASALGLREKYRKDLGT